MWLLYYYLRTWFACLRRHKSFRRTSFHVGKEMYNNYKGDDKKSKCQVLRELNTLSRYWRCFPDSYFRFAQFKKEWNDMELMKTYVPQGGYARYCVNSFPRYQVLIDDKILYHDIMSRYGLPVPDRFFSYSYEMFKADGRLLSDQDVDQILDRLTDPEIFIKQNMCGEGSGVFLAKRKDDGYYEIDFEQLANVYDEKCKLLILCGIIIGTQIYELRSEKTYSARIILKHESQILCITYICIKIDLLSVESNVFFSLKSFEKALLLFFLKKQFLLFCKNISLGLHINLSLIAVNNSHFSVNLF